MSAPTFVPPKVASALGLVSMALTAAAAFTPAPWNGLVAILGFCGAALAGAALPQLKLAAGKAIVGPAAVTIVGTAGAGVEQLAGLLPAGSWQQALVFAGSAMLAWLAGRAVPQLGAATAAGASASAGVDSLPKAVEALNK